MQKQQAVNQQILSLSLRGYTNAEIAEILDIDLGDVKKSLAEARSLMTLDLVELAEQYRAVSLARSEKLYRRINDALEDENLPTRLLPQLVRAAVDVLRYQDSVMNGRVSASGTAVQVVINNTLTTGDALYREAAEVISLDGETAAVLPEPHPALNPPIEDRLDRIEEIVSKIVDHA